MKQIPKCPSQGTKTPYTTSYESGTNPDVYTVYCSGSNHLAAGCDKGYPKFTATQGLIENKAADPEVNKGN